MVQKILLIGSTAALLSLTSSCYDGRGIALRYGPPELSHSQLPVAHRIGTVLSDTTALCLPTDIAAVGAYLVVIDIASDSVIHVLERATGTHRAQFGRRGGGPGEFASAWSLDPVQNDSSLIWVYDIELRRLTQVDIASSMSRHQLVRPQMVSVTSSAVPTGPVWLSDTSFVSLGFFTNGRLGYFNEHGAHTRSVGALPPGSEQEDPSVRQHAYRATLVRHPYSAMLAAATRTASLLQVFGSDGVHIVDFDGPLVVRPQYRVGNGVSGRALQSGPDLRYGYVDVYAAADKIYGLFSGRTREGFPKSAFHAQYIHVFDWRGNLLSVLRTDAALVSIALDPKGRWIYGIRHNPTPAILRFAI